MSVAGLRPHLAQWLQGSLLLLLLIIATWLWWQQQAAPVYAWPAWPRGLIALGTVAAYAALCGVCLRRPAERTAVVPVEADAITVVYASQTGFAAQLAAQTVAALRAAGREAASVDLSTLDPGRLGRRIVLFVVSTTGEGDAPDSAFAFVRRAMPAPADLNGLRYGVLALGDRSYARFCAFGHRLEHWLRLSGARALFDLIEVDNGDAAALRHWQQQLRQLCGHVEITDWRTPAYERWRLVARTFLNRGSIGGAVYRIALRPLDGERRWQAGDIAEIGPCNAVADVGAWLAGLGRDGRQRCLVDGEQQILADALRTRLLPRNVALLRDLDGSALLERLPVLSHREYSIASLPQDGVLELVVRQMRGDDGRLGYGSGWLTAHAAIGETLALRIRENRSFHLSDCDAPLLLIGNGTGIAGLRAHLKARIAAGRRRNWLLFGERQRACDALFGDDIAAWYGCGAIERVDLAFSRDQDRRVYVQDRLREASAVLRDWLAAGAYVLVCGSLDGMAPGVDAVLREVLGEPGYDAFVESGRYRRDVY